MRILSKLLTFWEARIFPPHISLWRTLYFNFRVLPFSKAIRFPILIYGKVRFPILAGKVEVNKTPLRLGMIKIGRQDPFSVESGRGFISISSGSKIIFLGPTHISTNCVLRIFDGVLVFGRYTYIGSDVKIICDGERIELGDYFRCAFQSVIINSSFHSLVDLKTKKCRPNCQSIIIGQKCWIGNRSTLTGGTKLKENTIIAAGSYVNNDYTGLDDNCQLIGGRPGKLLRSDIVRLYSYSKEVAIREYFKNNPNELYYCIGSYDLCDMSENEQEFRNGYSFI